MKILVVSKNKVFLEGSVAELEEYGVYPEGSESVKDGYDLLIIDRDTVPVPDFYKDGRILSLSHSGECDILLPCSAYEIVSEIRHLMPVCDGDKEKSAERNAGYSPHSDKNGISDDISLTPNEKRILEYLLSKHGESVSGRELEELFFKSAKDGSNIVNVYMSFLRKKLEHHSGKRVIETVRGKGFMLRDDVVREISSLIGKEHI